MQYNFLVQLHKATNKLEGSQQIVEQCGVAAKTKLKQNQVQAGR